MLFSSRPPVSGYTGESTSETGGGRGFGIRIRRIVLDLYDNALERVSIASIWVGARKTRCQKAS